MKKSTILFFLIAFTSLCYADIKSDFSLTWGKKERYTNGEDGYITDIVGKSSKYIYAYYSSGGIGNASNPDAYAKLIAFDCNTLERVFEQPLKGYKANKSTKSLDLLTYSETIVLDEVIYVFWIAGNTTTKQIFMSSYDLQLKPITTLKKIYESEGQRSDDFSPELVIKSNKKGHILIGAEKGTKENVKLRFAYRVVNSKLEFVSSKEVELPIVFDLKWGQNKSGLSSKYELLDDDNLVITTYIKGETTTTKKAQASEPSSFPMLSIVSVMTGDMKVYPFKFAGKFTNNIRVNSEGGLLKIMGTFFELNASEDGFTRKGIFTCSLDNKSLEVSQTVDFAYLSKANVEALHTKTLDFSISECKIMNVQVVDNNTIVFLSHRQNLANSTYSYCTNSNIYCISISSKGTVNWVALCDRLAKYTVENFGVKPIYYDINDIQVVKKDGNLLVLFDSETYLDAKGRVKTKTPREFFTYKDYLVLDPKNGKYKMAQIQVNSRETKKKNLNNLSLGHSYVFDDQLYTFYKVTKAKTFVSFTGWILLGLPYYFQGSYKGEGSIAKINLNK